MLEFSPSSYLTDAQLSRLRRFARDPQKRAALLHKIQQKAYDEARFMPIWENAFLCASGPRVAVSGLHRDSFAYSAPYEDVQLKSS